MKKFFSKIRKFFEIKLEPEEVVHITLVQIRAM